LPNYPYPVAKEDVYAVYQLAIEKSDELAINPQKVAIGGDSAGGTLATYVCKLADENHIQLPCFQMLIYPAVDATMQTKSMKNFTDTPIWNSKENKKYGGCICKTVKD
jgi:acetyl esterase